MHAHTCHIRALDVLPAGTTLVPLPLLRHPCLRCPPNVVSPVWLCCVPRGDQDAGSEAMGLIATSSDTKFVGIPDDIDIPPSKVGTKKVPAPAAAAGAGTAARTAAVADVVGDKRGGVWLNTVSNNVYWKVTLAPQETVSIPFEYTIEVGRVVCGVDGVSTSSPGFALLSMARDRVCVPDCVV